MKNKKTIVLCIAIIGLVLYGCSEKNNFGPLGSAHKHADIKVYVLGNEIDFGLLQYQLRDRLVHFEEYDGDVLHTHTTGMTFGYMFKTLGMQITDECLKSNEGNKYCTQGDAKLNVFIKNMGSEWEKISYAADYVIQDLDKILVVYGTEDEEGIKELMESVTNKAAVASRAEE